MTESSHSGDALESDILAASGPGAGQIEVDMPVVDLHREPVGRVKEVRERDFLIDRPMARDVYVPFRFVLAMENPGDRVRGGPTQPPEVILTISAGQLEAEHFPHP